MKKFGIAASFLLATAGTVSAQELPPIGLELGLSTLGAYMAPSIDITEKIAVRAPIYSMGFKSDFDIEGNEGEGSLDVKSFGLMADYYLWRGLRVSAGIAKGGYDLTVGVTDPELGDMSFDGDVKLTLAQEKDVAPVLSVGYAGTIFSGLGMFFEAGARFTALELTYSNSTIAAAEMTDFENEVAIVNEDLKDFAAIPFATLGVSWTF